MVKYTLTSTDFPPLKEGDKVVHNGTGAIKSKYRLVQPWTVDNTGDVHRQLGFEEKEYSITVLSLKIDTTETPNWFGVSFRKGIQSFDSVNIFVHPDPGHAGMKDDTYQARSGSWPRLFRYAEMLGRQMSVATNDQIMVIPFFSNASILAGGGLFTLNWKDLVDQILKLASANAQAANTPAAPANAANLGPFGAARAAFEAAVAPPVNYTAALKNVVLSNFSRGRALMSTIRKTASGLGSYLREVWDYDGNPAPVPAPSSGVRVLLYDQLKDTKNGPNTFHVPPKRWFAFHGEAANNPKADVHSNIPDMLAWHTGTVTGVGKRP